MIKIGVISDTHLKEPHSEFKKVIESYFRDVDKILHVGDFVDWSVAEYLSSLKELVAVCGNMDPPDIRKAFPHKRIIELEGFHIGLIHGGGSPFGIESRVREEFDEVACAAYSAEADSAAKAGPELQRRSVAAIIYGHTHTPANHQVKNILFFNPGSPTRSFIRRATLGILNIGEKVEGEIIPIK